MRIGPTYDQMRDSLISGSPLQTPKARSNWAKDIIQSRGGTLLPETFIAAAVPLRAEVPALPPVRRGVPEPVYMI